MQNHGVCVAFPSPVTSKKAKENTHAFGRGWFYDQKTQRIEVYSTEQYEYYLDAFRHYQRITSYGSLADIFVMADVAENMLKSVTFDNLRARVCEALGHGPRQPAVAADLELGPLASRTLRGFVPEHDEHADKMYAKNAALNFYSGDTLSYEVNTLLVLARLSAHVDGHGYVRDRHDRHFNMRAWNASTGR